MKAIVEKQPQGSMLVLLPDGQVIPAASAIEAASIIRSSYGEIEIEWRGCEPPKKGKR